MPKKMPMKKMEKMEKGEMKHENFMAVQKKAKGMMMKKGKKAC